MSSPPLGSSVTALPAPTCPGRPHTEIVQKGRTRAVVVVTEAGRLPAGLLPAVCAPSPRPREEATVDMAGLLFQHAVPWFRSSQPQ